MFTLAPAPLSRKKNLVARRKLTPDASPMAAGAIMSDRDLEAMLSEVTVASIDTKAVKESETSGDECYNDMFSTRTMRSY